LTQLRRLDATAGEFRGLVAHGTEEVLDFLAERGHGVTIPGQCFLQGAKLRADRLAIGLGP